MSDPAIHEYLRAVGIDPAATGPSDAELIARFSATRDEAAFELLVWRHAPLLQRVCRSVLNDRHAAEDATQATFLALARRAGTFAGRGSVVGWLYRVARRVPVRLAEHRLRSATNLKQIMIAIHSYHDENGFLPRDIADKNGKPLLSWRVLLLPHIEQGALFKQFSLFEPWDSAGNKALSRGCAWAATARRPGACATWRRRSPPSCGSRDTRSSSTSCRLAPATA